jgi:hypothetical protein
VRGAKGCPRHEARGLRELESLERSPLFSPFLQTERHAVASRDTLAAVCKKNITEANRAGKKKGSHHALGLPTFLTSPLLLLSSSSFSSRVFTRFVEIGRVVLINDGKFKNKLAVIVDVIDMARVSCVL